MATAVMDAQASESHRARRTEAIPKTSLFGSPLEIQDENVVKNFRVDSVQPMKAHSVKGPGIRFTLPDDVKNQLPAAAILEQSKRRFEEQRDLVHQNSHDLKEREERILFSRSYTSGALHNSNNQANRHTLTTPLDLKGCKEINSVGLNTRQSYNRDKYQRKPAVHNYRLLGDILRPGMDMPRRERTEVQMRNQGYGKGDLRGILSEPEPRPRRSSDAAGTSKTPPKACIDIPPNIKHKFGTKECDKLLSNREVVEQTIKEQQDEKVKNPKKSNPFIVPQFSRDINPEYEMLGNSLRMNVVPGYSIDHRISTTKTAFNDQVHLFRHKDPDKWRYQKDELSKWREARFLQQLLAKGWDTLQQDAPKFQRNWESAPRERTKTAPATNTQKRPRPPPKPKTAAKKKETIEDSGFEEIVFKTPPRTPSPEKVQIVQNKRDTEFWDFYDKK